jgi:hypothetical protein
MSSTRHCWGYWITCRSYVGPILWMGRMGHSLYKFLSKNRVSTNPSRYLKGASPVV